MRSLTNMYGIYDRTICMVSNFLSIYIMYDRIYMHILVRYIVYIYRIVRSPPCRDACIRDCIIFVIIYRCTISGILILRHYIRRSTRPVRRLPVYTLDATLSSSSSSLHFSGRPIFLFSKWPKPIL